MKSPADWPRDAGAISEVRSLLGGCDFAHIVAFGKSWNRLPVAVPVSHIAVERAEQELAAGADPAAIVREVRAMRLVLQRARDWDGLLRNCVIDERYSPPWSKFAYEAAFLRVEVQYLIARDGSDPAQFARAIDGIKQMVQVWDARLTPKQRDDLAYLLGHALYLGKRYAEAIPYLEAVAAKPRSRHAFDASQCLIIALAHCKRPQDAEDHFRQFLVAMRPSRDEVRALWGEISAVPQ